jgi:hypothetical protein
MTTAAQVKKMVRPLLERHPDLALVGRRIYLTPVHHFARAVVVGRTSSAKHFDPCWAVVHLFEVCRSFPLSWGGLLSDPHQGHWWSEENDRGVAGALVRAIEEQALPWLRTMSTLDLYLAFVSQNQFRHHLYDKGDSEIVYLVACGHLAAARAICEKHLESWSIDKPHYDEDDKAKFRRLRELCALLESDDRLGLARLLHEWEAETVKNFKIEHLWEPTPFPLELQISK